MTLRIRLSSSMKPEEFWPLWPDIIVCLERYCQRFDDETVANIVKQVVEGRRQLWLVQDDTGRVILTPITEIVTLDSTSEKRLHLAEVGGERLRDCMPLLQEIEEWARREHGAVKATMIARKGWKRLLEPLGYKPKAVLWQKEL